MIDSWSFALLIGANDGCNVVTAFAKAALWSGKEITAVRKDGGTNLTSLTQCTHAARSAIIMNRIE